MRATVRRTGLGFLALLAVACSESPESFGGNWAGYIDGSPSWAYLQQDDGDGVAGNITYPSGALVGSVHGNKLTFTLTTGDVYCTGMFRGSATIEQLPDRKRMTIGASGADSCTGARTYSGHLDLLLCMQPSAMCGPDWTGADPYCADVSSDLENCGQCGWTCDVDRACVSGRCLPVACTGPVPLEDPTSRPAGPSRVTMVLSDVDGDGVLDAVTSAQTVLLVFPGDGVGAFLGPVGTTFDGAVASTAGDVDADGRVDLVVYAIALNRETWTYESAIHVLLGKGDGGFGTGAVISLGEETTDPILYRPVALADLDGDGALDLVSRAALAPLLQVRSGDGAGGFGPPTDVSLSGAPTGIVPADLDGDGDVDLAVVTTSGYALNPVDVLLGNGDGTFTLTPGTDVLGGTGDVVVADLDGDGALDVVVARSWAYEAASALYGKGDGSFETAVPIGPGPGSFAVDVADLDGDGTMDVVAGGWDLAFLLGRGSRTFQNYAHPITAPGNLYGVVARDLDGDGRTDVVAAISRFSGPMSSVDAFRACDPVP